MAVTLILIEVTLIMNYSQYMEHSLQALDCHPDHGGGYLDHAVAEGGVLHGRVDEDADDLTG